MPFSFHQQTPSHAAEMPFARANAASPLSNDLADTSAHDHNPLAHALHCLLVNGLDGAAEALRILVNEAAKIERAQYLKASPYERNAQREDHANGFKPKTMNTRLGTIEFAIPQVRNAGFYPTALERGTRTEQSLNLAMAEMYVQGVSSRKVIAVLQKLLGAEISISSSQVSRCVERLDQGLIAWRARPLGQTPYVLLDARYEKVRHEGHIVDCAVLVAVGVKADGKRSVLGVSVALSEAEVHWRAFLNSLVERGLRGVQLVVSDDHAGLRAARKAVLTSIPWQRCQFHLQQNAQQYITRLEQRATVGAQIRAIFNSVDQHEANRALQSAVNTWQQTHPKLASWAEQNISQGFTVFALPQAHRIRLRTTNGLERINKELKRRTRVVSVFPNAESCLRLVSALLSEQDEQWLASYVYLNMEVKT